MRNYTITVFFFLYGGKFGFFHEGYRSDENPSAADEIPLFIRRRINVMLFEPADFVLECRAGYAQNIRRLAEVALGAAKRPLNKIFFSFGKDIFKVDVLGVLH